MVYNGNVSGETGSFTNNVTNTYKNDATYGESEIVETYTSTVGSTATTYTYTYDSNGNIGSKGVFFSKEWTLKLFLGQEFVLPFKIPMDKLRKGIWGTDQ